MPHNSAAFFLFPDFENKAVSKTVLAENDMLFNKSISRVPADFIDKLRALPKERPCCLFIRLAVCVNGYARISRIPHSSLITSSVSPTTTERTLFTTPEIESSAPPISPPIRLLIVV